MPDSHSAAVDHNDSVNLISFFKAILTAATGVECVKRLGSFCWWRCWGSSVSQQAHACRGCLSFSDLEWFAKRHRQALNQALRMDFKRWPSDATFLYLYRFAEA